MKLHSVRCLSPSGFHTIRYRAFGEADNPRVAVCVHGLTRNACDFDALATALAKTHYVVCPDVVGRGQSDWLADRRGYGYPQYLADAAALLASLTVDQVDWVGTSMGGLIGMFLAAQAAKSGVNPIRRLVMNDVGPLVPKAALERINAYVGRDPIFNSIAEYTAFVKAISPFGDLSNEQWQYLAASGATSLPDGKVKSNYDPGIGDAFRAAAQGKPIDDVDMFAVWQAVRCPVLTIRGESSDLFSREVQQRMVEHAAKSVNTTAIEYKNCGHAPALLSDEQIQPIVAFLNP
jgi:pimeloyl-ACP methyl ester carboxylesterase